VTQPTKPVVSVEVTSEKEELVEPLLEESSGQYVIFPINNQDMWGMYKHFVDTFWSPAENLEGIDKFEFSYDEKQFMKFFSSFFASPESKGLVIDTFAEDFCKLIQVTEARFFYGHQLFVQDIHYEMFNRILDNIVVTNEEK
jgi:ribonucleotide reductase beta subunit family protein with ferritin-like domain